MIFRAPRHRARQIGTSFCFPNMADPSAGAFLYDGAIEIFRGAKFEALPDEQFPAESRALPENGVPKIGSYRTTGELARKYLYEHLGKIDNPLCRFSFSLKTGPKYTAQRPGGLRKNTTFTDLAIPRALNSYAPSPNSIRSSLLPDQATASWISKEVAFVSPKGPPFTPF